ncbi:hypothetical protein [Flavobacterium frigoris]|uniref:DUF4304 domain-containing protein n=1 Tax=Flavobacterium frigoris TaxID=229204 RepID=A0A1H9QKJ0_FLAFI|nr:hypothetical protein [Flavobacterium frigoris]SER60948.1 hypothetical protein SAMN05444355_1172 [Flavobacterium frigoris]
MKISELTKHINEAVKQRLSPLGFKKDGYGFTLNENGFTKKIIFSSIDRDNSFPTSFSVWFGFLGVDRVLFRATGNEVDLKKIKHGGQVFIRQVELFEQGTYPFKDYDIYTFEQADDAVSESLNYFIDFIIPDMNKFKSVLKLEEQINLKGQFINDRFLSTKVKYGLILAKLVNNPNYEFLKNKYRELLNDWSDWDKQELEKVIDFIDTHSQEELLKIAEE